LIDYSIFLDIDITDSLKRRNKVIDHDMAEYTNKILVPGHRKYVEPTKRYADLVINIEKIGKEEMIETATQKLRDAKIL
jgi:uridine kinase